MARRPVDAQDGPGFFDDAPEAVPVAAPAARSGRRLIVEADGGSRGNPGPAAYGALVRDAETGETLMAEGLALGAATNNVAEYSGLIAGLEMVQLIDPDAAVEVRMDSKLVIEQMAGRWKIKHPAMKPLALRASALRPARVRWTWVPRAENKRADALVNAALDGAPLTREEPVPSRP
jgi:probable phosphoglycerate mutase